MLKQLAAECGGASIDRKGTTADVLQFEDVAKASAFLMKATVAISNLHREADGGENGFWLSLYVDAENEATARAEPEPEQPVMSFPDPAKLPPPPEGINWGG